jgi:hypothetical protein
MKLESSKYQNLDEQKKNPIHAWFSMEQFKAISIHTNGEDEKIKPYIYYYTHNKKIIQITQVSQTSNKYPSKFSDYIYLGTVSKFYGCFETPLSKHLLDGTT